MPSHQQWLPENSGAPDERASKGQPEFSQLQEAGYYGAQGFNRAVSPASAEQSLNQSGFPPAMQFYEPQYTPGYEPQYGPGYAAPPGPGYELPSYGEGTGSTYEPTCQPGYGPGYQPYQPGFPPNYEPGFPSGNMPGFMPGYEPGSPSWLPPAYEPGFPVGFPPGYEPGFQPALPPGYGPGFQPGFQPGYGPGFQPGNGPGFQPGNAPEIPLNPNAPPPPEQVPANNPGDGGSKNYYQQILQQSEQSINSNGIDQGSHGDCVFEASLAAVANTPGGQQMIQGMIKPTQDGYSVTFPGDSKNPVNVSMDDIKKANVSDSQLWAKILETAMLSKYTALSKGTSPDTKAGGTDGNQPTPAQYALYLLTGKVAPKTHASDSDTAGKINQSLTDGQPVVAYCHNDDNGALVSGHEWTVMNYDANTKEITLRNPWGSTPQSDASKSGITDLGNGEVRMSLQTFQKDYDEVTFGSVS